MRRCVGHPAQVRSKPRPEAFSAKTCFCLLERFGLLGSIPTRQAYCNRRGTVSFTTCLLVTLGGAVGTLLRYGIGEWAQPISKSLPWGTIFINIAGSFVIGFFGTLTLANGKYPVSENARLFVMVGLCGGFTTFSAFSLQTLDLLRDGAALRAGANVVLSVVMCVVAAWAGHVIASGINGGAVAIAQVKSEEQA
jgi:fluoride exporter